MIRDSSCVNILVAGDMNAHFSRNSRFTNIVRDFFEDELNFKIFFETTSEVISPVDYTHMFLSENVTSFSTIDHFVGNQNVIGAVMEAGVAYFPENLSNHSPIHVKLNVGHLCVSTEDAVSQKRTYCNKATEDEKEKFKDTLPNKLNSLIVPACVACQNIHCNIHSEDYTMNVLQSIESSAQDCLPYVGGYKLQGGTLPGRVAGWSEHMAGIAQEETPTQKMYKLSSKL